MGCSCWLGARKNPLQHPKGKPFIIYSNGTITRNTSKKNSITKMAAWQVSFAANWNPYVWIRIIKEGSVCVIIVSMILLPWDSRKERYLWNVQKEQNLWKSPSLPHAGLKWLLTNISTTINSSTKTATDGHVYSWVRWTKTSPFKPPELALEKMSTTTNLKTFSWAKPFS